MVQWQYNVWTDNSSIITSVCGRWHRIAAANLRWSMSGQLRKAQVSAKSSPELSSELRLHNRVERANFFASGAIIASGIFAISAAILELPALMIAAAGLAAVGAGAAVKKLRFLEPYLRDEQKRTSVMQPREQSKAPTQMVMK